MSLTVLEQSKIMSKPAAGRTMLSLFKTQGSILLEAYNILRDHLEGDQFSDLKDNCLNQFLLFRFYEADRITVERNRYSLISASLILNWVCGRISNKVSAHNDLLDAEMIFNRITPDYCISSKIKPEINKAVVGYLSELNNDILLETLPYLVEVFETGNENANEKGTKRAKKKKNGIYYTPTDVVEFIINRSLSNRTDKLTSIENLKWLDPALGTGSFLLSVLKYYFSSNSENNIGMLISYFKKNLFGTDISPLALQSASYILATNCLSEGNEGDLKIVAKILGSNLVLQDATTITTKEKLHALFPEIGIDGVDFLVSNPPYSKKVQIQLNLFNKEKGKDDYGDDLYPDFIKLLFELTKVKHGGGGMVVPLSLSASSKERFKSLRTYINSKDGLIEFLNFDRTPDSLFGDDVKIRNTIIFYNHYQDSKRNINTSYLHRWNSRNREDLFTSITLASLTSDINITNGVPKIGDQLGIKMLDKVSSTQHGILKDVLRRSEVKSELRTKTTAYNWIPVELNSGVQPESTVGRIFWEVTSDTVSSPMIYSILNSRITYWLWRIWGDGFHLTNQFIYALPYGRFFFQSIDKKKLENLGLKLWDNVQRELVVTKNAGLVSHSFSPLGSIDLIDEIDKLLISYYGLTDITVDYLRKYVHELIISGRYSENRIMSKIKY